MREGKERSRYVCDTHLNIGPIQWMGISGVNDIGSFWGNKGRFMKGLIFFELLCLGGFRFVSSGSYIESWLYLYTTSILIINWLISTTTKTPKMSNSKCRKHENCLDTKKGEGQEMGFGCDSTSAFPWFIPSHFVDVFVICCRKLNVPILDLFTSTFFLQIFFVRFDSLIIRIFNI